jgi:hypothetical protein
MSVPRARGDAPQALRKPPAYKREEFECAEHYAVPRPATTVPVGAASPVAQQMIQRLS